MRFRLYLFLSLGFLYCFTFLPQNQVLAEQSEFPPAQFLERPDVFPIGVWLQDPENALEYKAIGINFYAGLWQGPTESQLSQLQAARLAVFTPQNILALQNKYRDIIAGWMMPDEPDNAQAREGGGFGPPVLPDTLIDLYREMKARDPERPILLNLGQGVAWDQWHGRGTRTNHPEDYQDYVRAADILSFDIYPVTHRDSSVRGRLDFVARGVNRLIGWSEGTKPVWSVIEASRVSNADILPTGNQVRNLVWLSIIHGAQGIIYFVHQFTPNFVEASLLENDILREDITAINKRLQSLARVLKSETLVDAVSIQPGRSSNQSVSALVKQDNCHLYIFAGSISKFSNEARFEIKDSQGLRDVEVMDEARHIPLDGGSFQDNFGPYATHLYKVSRNAAGCE
ncbi:hypothetical protein [Sneathiella litorea]|uniref:Glycoside hydrolase family 42 N-terminal domain-containing protein n=1 Tax=Sneathiella litorea TaxID=2606216 RepID=A0A6L8W3U4_9PROT|nr:hypothetical protein [Sneathiella litorea]MZR29688.1 hypothetical protein [Sneathiella litorea]